MLSLVAAPGGLLPPHARAAADALRAAGAAVAAGTWLGAGEAWEAAFAGLPPARAEAAVRTALAGVAADVAATPAAGRRKRLLAADMDSTIVGQECLDRLAARAGVGAQVAELTRRAMAGEMDFAQALRRRVALLAGRPAALLRQTLEADVRLNPGARTLVATMQAHGAGAALLTGGFRCFAEPMAARAGFDDCTGNRLGVEEGVLTGRLVGPVEGGAESKRATLVRLAARRGVPLAATLAVGDGANDATMLRTAGLGVAFRARPAARAAAAASIDHAGLTALLYLQGYRRDEFVAADGPGAVASA